MKKKNNNLIDLIALFFRILIASFDSYVCVCVLRYYYHIAEAFAASLFFLTLLNAYHIVDHVKCASRLLFLVLLLFFGGVALLNPTSLYYCDKNWRTHTYQAIPYRLKLCPGAILRLNSSS